MTESDFVLPSYTFSSDAGKTQWSAPSNIALVKYWGKYPSQIPANASVSFTLNNCKTETNLTYTKKKIADKDLRIKVFFEGELKDSFLPKVETFFLRVEPYLPFVREYNFEINTSNTFPHSSGIASSASGMAALALCLMEMERLFNKSMTDDFFYRKASFLARLGSGSACRSIKGNLVEWGIQKSVPNSSNLYGIEYPFAVHKVFKNYQDTILLVHKGVKTVSSSVGHNLMNEHPYAQQRFEQAQANLSKLKPVFASGDLKKFIEIVESEALNLHAMMMSSLPYFVLMKPNTLEIIERVWEHRQQSGSHLCFTLDAGANVHLLYPEEEKEIIKDFIEKELVAYCENGHYICDHVGSGAKKM